MSLNRLIHSIRDLTLSLNPYRGTRHQPKEKSVHHDSLLDRKKSNAPIKKQTPSITLNDTFICLPAFYK